MGLKWLSVAAGLVLMVVTSMHFLPYHQGDEDFRLTLDINPSIELSYDDQFYLTGWRSFNQAGTELLGSLEQPETVYEALALIFRRSVQLGLAAEDHDVFITTAWGTPLDEDRVLGAFEGRGTAVNLHLVHLDKDEYKGDSVSPLRAHLRHKAGIAPDDQETPVAVLAATHLAPELVTIIHVAPWHNDPLVQLFIEQYGVNSKTVEQMLDEGLTAEQVAHLLELAQADKLTPADLFKELLGSGLPPGQFLQQHRQSDKVKAPGPIVLDWLPEVLAQEFGYSGGQLSSYLRSGITPADLQALLVLETLTGDKLQHLIKKLESSDLQTVIAQSGVDMEVFDELLNQLKLLIEDAGIWVDSEDAVALVKEQKVTRAEALSILVRGYNLEEAKEVIGMAKGSFGLREVLETLESAVEDEEILEQLDKDKKATRVREKLKINPPGNKNKPGLPISLPGQQPGLPSNSGKGNGNN
jgi:hypothetical protein